MARKKKRLKPDQQDSSKAGSFDESKKTTQTTKRGSNSKSTYWFELSEMNSQDRWALGSILAF
ncbi:MAG: hypothetical protein AAF202_12305, partial [Pseudomonadota bacterium]